MNRRNVLLSTLGVLTATVGCSGLGNGVTDFSISTDSEETLTATIRVTTVEDNTQLLSETFDIGPDKRKQYEEVVSGQTVNVHLSVEDGAEDTYEWFDDTNDSGKLVIQLSRESISFQPAIS